MSTGNAFAALGHEKKKPAASTEKLEEPEAIITTDVSDAAVENAEWQPAVTAKTRRLVPQSSQARPSEQPAVAGLTSPTKSSADVAKKKGKIHVPMSAAVWFDSCLYPHHFVMSTCPCIVSFAWSLARYIIPLADIHIHNNHAIVIRFTKEEMLGARKPCRMLSSMSDMLEVVSLTALDPVCFEKLDPDDVVRIWNTSSSYNNKDGTAGRGRGRGRKEDGQGGGGGGHNEGGVPDWSRGQPASGKVHGGKAGPWDDAGSKGGANSFDLADFAAAAQKFNDEMKSMRLTEEDEAAAAAMDGEDMMTRLLREQTGRGLGVGIGGGIEDDEHNNGLLQEDEIEAKGLAADDDEEMPSWADDDADDGVELLSEDKVKELFMQAHPEGGAGNGAKRNLLMSVRKIT
jgi:hypothetical protein